jgi:arabinan endo-1,5-alpha-L-arabinosidase
LGSVEILDNPMMRSAIMRIVTWTIPAVVLASLALPSAAAQQQSDSAAPRVVMVEGDVEDTHDPSIIKEGSTWYVFSTGNGRDRGGELPIRCSQDLVHWKHCGYVLPAIPDWIKKESPKTRELWAPDISYFNSEYHLYYAFSAFGKNISGIALLVNKTLDPASPDFHWEDRGLVLQSRLEDDFNAIDPNLVVDAKGHAWLSFGSFWSGIKMQRIDPKTGKLRKHAKLYSLARREAPANPPAPPPGLPGNWQAIEAPFVVRHDRYYYLFASFDLCCRGPKSNYRTMVGRSRKVTGPYVDADGKRMLQGGGTQLLVGNQRWAGPGGESVLQQTDEDIIVFHAYDVTTGHPFLQISTITWVDGWPRATLDAGTESGAP